VYQLFSMTDSNLLSLGQQLAMRAKTFCNSLGLTQNKLARLLQVDDSQFSRFLNGTSNLSAEKTLKLVRLLSCSKRDLALKFASPEKLTARLMHLQESGRKLAEVVHFAASNDGWVPGLSGTDPILSGDDITTIRSTGAEGDDPSYNDLTRTLAQVQALHRQAIQIIADYETRQKAKPNPNGSTGPARQISRPKTPGPSGDLI
jgi:transcriptional regulator with XRE-family HTH domain